MITPGNIVDLIKETYNVDITEKGRGHVKNNLKSIYFYLCAKYCNSVLYGYVEIGNLVNVNHPNVTTRAQQASDRIGVVGWEDFELTLKKLEYIIKEKYSNDEDYLSHIELESYDTIMLKRRIKAQSKRFRKLNNTINKLNKRLLKLNN